MKLRIRGDSIRVRLTQAEVRALAAEGAVEDGTTFLAGGRLTYALAVAPDGPVLSAVLSSSGGAARIEVRIEKTAADAWAAGDDVGVEAEQPTGDGRVLRILVEKDFACLKPRPHEEDEDAFPNPNKSC
jgi:hypothetical protein